ncbi:transcription factor-like protein [Perkinsela sp. CCAP 1560/4]|nr:transcription factor-like protein [Perkinsela sp. CCAP 1560/4]|eukprot:KNH05487.1 transcription factor-like protein [Perkinsela sp. CCAP 1560/4]
MTPNNSVLFRRRVGALRTVFGLTEEGTPKMALAILVGEAHGDTPENQKNVAMNVHVFDQHKPIDASLVVVTSTEFRIFTAKGHPEEEFLTALSNETSSGLLPVEYTALDSAEVRPAQFQSLFQSIQGFFLVQKELEIQQGKIAEAFRGYLSLHHSSTVQEAGPRCTQALAVKDDQAVEAMRKAASFASIIMKSYVLPTLEEIMLQDEEDAPYRASAFAADIERTIAQPKHIRGLENIKSEVYGIALAPVRIHMGGGKMQLLSEESVLPRDKQIKPQALSLCYAVRYRGYASYIGRTVLYNCDKSQKDAYESLVGLMGHFTGLLVPGAVISACWAKAREWYAGRHAELAQFLNASGGFGLGLEMLSSASWLSEKNKRTLQPGMAFAVRLALEDVSAASSAEPFSILLADTFLVQPPGNESTQILTSMAPFELDEVSRKVSKHESEAEAGDGEVAPAVGLRVHTRSSERANKGANLQLEMNRKAMQAELIAKKRASGRQTTRGNVLAGELDHTEMSRLARGEMSLNFPQMANDGDLKAFYARHLAAQTPGVHAYYNIILDTDREILLLPNLAADGSLSVVHICTVKNVEIKSEQEDRSATARAPSLMFRIQFHGATESNAAYLTNPGATFIKELAFRIVFKLDANTSGNQSQVIVQNMQNLIRHIKLTQAAIANRESTRQANADIQEQTGLVFARALDTTRVLRDVRCYPNPRMTASGRSASSRQGTVGTVEVHTNGVRFVQKDTEPLVVLFSNIATAIFQPADNDQRIVFHLHLKHNILVGKKKTKDLQFYLDVTDESEGVGTRRRDTSWEDEYAEEEMERQRTARLNSEFLHFAKGFEAASGNAVEAPIRKFHFFGTHDKGMVKFKGSECTLFSLTEAPQFVQRMHDVEIAVFERVTALKTNFDITFVRTDFTFTAINNIEYKYLDKIKDWLNEASTKYYETGVNLVWRTILKEVKADEAWDPWGPEGWDAILRDTDSERESEADAESDSSFVMSSSASSASDGGSAYVSDETTSSSEESAYSDSGASDSDDDEEGLDWDELEEKAAKEDRKRTKRAGGSDDEGAQRRPRRR